MGLEDKVHPGGSADRWKLALAAVVASLVGFLGVLEIGEVPYGGYWSGPGNTVVRVFESGPAEIAGFQVGDVVQSVGGVSVVDAKGLARRARPEIGETRRFVVQRNGETVEMGLVYAGLPARERRLAYAEAAIGLCYLGFGLWPYSRAATPAARYLALFGLCFGAAFLPGPYLHAYFPRTLGGALVTLLVVIGFAFLVHLLLVHPTRRPMLDRQWATRRIYGPALVVALFLLFRILFRPEATSDLETLTHLLVSLFVLGYFGWAGVLMISSFLRASAEERRERGLTLMLFGTVAGLAPITLSTLVGTIAPGVVLPWVELYFLTLVLIPVCFAVALRRR